MTFFSSPEPLRNRHASAHAEGAGRDLEAGRGLTALILAERNLIKDVAQQITAKPPSFRPRSRPSATISLKYCRTRAAPKANSPNGKKNGRSSWPSFKKKKSSCRCSRRPSKACSRNELRTVAVLKRSSVILAASRPAFGRTVPSRNLWEWDA